MKTSTAPLPPLRSVKVLDQLRERIRYLHYSLRTEQVLTAVDSRTNPASTAGTAQHDLDLVSG